MNLDNYQILKENEKYGESGCSPYVVFYDTIKFINDNPHCRYSNLKEYIYEKYGDRIDYSEYINMCKSELRGEDTFFVLTKECKDVLLRFESIKDEYIKNLDLSKDELIENIINSENSFRVKESNTYKSAFMDIVKELSNDFQSETNIISSLLLINSIEEGDRTFYHYFDMVFEFVMNYKTYFSKIELILSRLKNENLNLSIENLCFCDSHLYVFEKLAIETIGAFTNAYSSDLFSMYILNYSEFLSKMEFLSVDFIEISKFSISEMFNCLKENYKEVLFLKYGILDEKYEEKTLEETGNLLGVTRERIRQMIDVALKKLTKHAKSASDICDNVISYNYENKMYITIEELEKVTQSKKTAIELSILLSSSENTNMRYDENYSIFYSSNYITINEIVNSKISQISNIISMEQYERMNHFEKQVVKRNYSLRMYNFYVRKGLTIANILLEEIDLCFPEGYHIINDFEKLKICFCDKYTDKLFEYKPHSIAALLEQYNYCLIERGKYKNIKYCPIISDELLSEISDYILESGTGVYYETIFNKYSNKLFDIGITNKYFLKGILDPVLDKEVFFTKKDYILVGQKSLTLTEQIIIKYESYNDVFSMEDMKDIYPGVKEYTLFNCLRNNKFIWLSGKRFIPSKLVDITFEDYSIIEEMIENVFKLSNNNPISARKVYAKIRISHKNILEKLKYATDHFSFFSIIKHFFNKKYYWRRPYISKTEDVVMTRESLIMNYVLQKEMFNFLDIETYRRKMNIGGLYSYLDFLDEMCYQGYIQYDKGTMIRQDLFLQKVTKENMNKIINVVDLLLSKREILNTENFSGYQLFPEIGYRWNKYLLVGILKSFYSDKYIINNTTNFYDTTDYLISIGSECGLND